MGAYPLFRDGAALLNLPSFFAASIALLAVVAFNGIPHDNPYIDYRDIIRGGELTFEMTAGSSGTFAPPKF